MLDWILLAALTRRAVGPPVLQLGFNWQVGECAALGPSDARRRLRSRDTPCDHTARAVGRCQDLRPVWQKSAGEVGTFSLQNRYFKNLH